MKPHHLLLVAALLPITGLLAADPPAKVPSAPKGLGAFHFPLRLLFENAQKLNLTTEQRDFLKNAHEEAQAERETEAAKHEKLNARFTKLIADDEAEEEEILNQLNRILHSERKMRSIELSLLVRITRQLTPEQRSQIDTLKKRHHPATAAPSAPQQRIPAKVQRVREEIQLLQSAGTPPYKALQLMEQLPAAFEAQDFQRAESILDDVLIELGLEEGEPSQRNPTKPKSDRPKRPAP